LGIATTVIVLGTVVAASAGLFFFRDGIKNAFASPEQKAADAAKIQSAANIDNSIAKGIDSLTTLFTGTSKTNITKTDAVLINEILNDPNSDINKFNPPDTVGFGFLDLNGGKGLKDTPENRELVEIEIQKSQARRINNLRFS